MPRNPLAEVFGFPVDNFSDEAQRHRAGRLCPYHNSSGINCTKNSAIDPLGVCSVFEGEGLAIICPIRFRESYLVVEDAAKFFFPTGTRYIALTEVRLNDRHGKSAGNIDIVLVALDEDDVIIDFGALEVQAVYISGNISRVFKEYMKDPITNHNMVWPAKNYPTPDYLSSSRKRLAPQLIYKGGIMKAWGKKTAVAVHRTFYEQLPTLPEVAPSDADIAWMIYNLVEDNANHRYKLVRSEIKYTRFEDALGIITRSEAGDQVVFVNYLAQRIKSGRIMGTPSPIELPPAVEPPLHNLDNDAPKRDFDFDNDDSSVS